MKGRKAGKRAISWILVVSLIFFSLPSNYLHAADPLLDPVTVATTDPFASTADTSAITSSTPTSTESLSSEPLSAATISPELVVLRDVGGSTSWYEVKDGGRWTPFGNQYRTLEAEVLTAGDYTLRIWAKNFVLAGWKKPPTFTHFELSVKVDGVDAGILSIQADDFRFRFGELVLTSLSVGTHTLEVKWVNASGYDAAAKEDANLFLNTMVLEEVVNPVTSGAGHVLESKRWNHLSDNTQWTNFGGESMTFEVVSQGGDTPIYVVARNHNNPDNPNWSKGDNYMYYEFEVRMDGIYKGLLRVNADDVNWQEGSFVIANLAAGTHVVRLLWLNGGQYDLAAKTDPNVWIKSVSLTSLASPTVALTSPAEGSVINGTTAEIFYQLNGDLTGVDHLHMELYDAMGMKVAVSSAIRTFPSGSYSFTNVLPGVYSVKAFLAKADHSVIVGTEQIVNFTMQLDTVSVTGLGDRMIAAEGEGLELAVTGIDSDSGALTFSALNLPSFVSLVDNGNNTAALRVDGQVIKAAGDYTITVEALNSSGEIGTQTMVLTVDALAEPHFMLHDMSVHGHATIPALVPFGGMIMAETAEGTHSHGTMCTCQSLGITLKALSLPAGVNFDVMTGIYTWNAGLNQAGDNILRFEGKDAEGYTYLLELPITVEAVVDTPVFTRNVEELVGTRGEILTINLEAVDPEGDAITFELADTDPNRFATGSVSLVDHGDGTASVLYAVGAQAFGYQYVRVKVKDSFGHERILPVVYRIGAEVTTVRDGFFDDPAVWASGVVPAKFDRVLINTHTITMRGTHELGELVVEGTGKLIASRTQSTSLKLYGSFLVLNGGTVDFGTTADPIPSTVTIDISFVVPHDDVMKGNDLFLPGPMSEMPDFKRGDIGLFVMDHGTMAAFQGAVIQNPWTRLSGDAVIGVSTITVEDAVTDWRVGDRILIVGWARGEESEVRTITAIQGNQITLDSPLTYYHPGRLYAVDPVTGLHRGITSSDELLTGEILVREQSEISLLSRNITIHSDTTLGQGFAHTLYMMGAEGYMNSTEFRDLGPTKLGRYPAHFHRLGEGQNLAFRDNAIWNVSRAGHKGIVVHDTHHARVEGNTIYNVLAVGIYEEVAEELYNDILNNLVVRVIGPETFPNLELTEKFGYDVSLSTGIWARTLNSFVDNVVVGADHGFAVTPLNLSDQHPEEITLFRNTVRANKVGVGFFGKPIQVDFLQGFLVLNESLAAVVSDRFPAVVDSVIVGFSITTLSPTFTGNTQLVYVDIPVMDTSAVPTDITDQDLDANGNYTISYTFKHGLLEETRTHTFAPVEGVNSVTITTQDRKGSTITKTIQITYTRTDPAATSVSNWRFEEGSGTLTQDSVGTTNGTIIGAAFVANGHEGSALRFDGVDDYVSMATGTQLDLPNAGGSFSLWVNIDPSVTLGQDLPMGIMGRRAHTNREASGNYGLQLYQGGPTDPHYFRVALGNENNVDLLTGRIEATNGVWHHVAVVWDATRLYLYVDGTLDRSMLRTQNLSYTNSLPLELGRFGGSKLLFYKGLLDEAAVFNRTLTAEEIAALAEVAPDTTAPRISNLTAANVGSSAVTITWDTDEPADTFVEYSFSDGTSPQFATSSGFSMSHSIALTGLNSSTGYRYRVVSSDQAGNTTFSNYQNFTTLIQTDSTPPVLSNIASINITENSATITWLTSGEASDSQVEYGTTTAYTNSSPLNSTMVSSHSVVLTNLTPNTLYHFRVKSRDAAGNLAASTTDFTFTTLAPTPAGDPPANMGTLASPIPNFTSAVYADGRNIIRSVANGKWSDAATWGSAGIPTANDVVIIDKAVEIDTFIDVHTIGIYNGGHLRFATNTNTQLRIVNLQVFDQGWLEVGSQASPIAGNVTANIIFKDVPLNTTLDPSQLSNGLMAFSGSKVTMEGQAMTNTFVRLAAEPAAGATTLTLSTAVDGANGWRVGDRIALPDSRHLAIGEGTLRANYIDQNEERIIDDISADGKTITLRTALTYAHIGARDGNGVIDPDFYPHVINLTRNVVLRSENAAGTRGYTLYRGRADVNIGYVQFQDLGRTKGRNAELTDDTTYDPTSGDLTHIGTNQDGRHAVYFASVIGAINSTNTGYQYQLRGAALNRSNKWAVRANTSYFGLIKDNVIYRSDGAGLAMLDASDNEIIGNFVIATEGNAKPRDNDPWNHGRDGVAFEFQNAFDNYVRDNVAASSINKVQEIITGTGYQFFTAAASWNQRLSLFRGADVQGSSAVQGVHYELKNTQRIPIAQFQNNEAYGGSMATGLSIWQLGTSGYDDPVVPETVIKDFKVWHVWEEGVFGYPMNHVTFDGLIVRGNRKGGGFRCGDYRCLDIKIINSNFQGLNIGIWNTTNTPRTFAIQDSYFRNLGTNITVEIQSTPGNRSGKSPRVTTIDNVRFDRWTPTSGLSTISMYYNAKIEGAHYTIKDEVFVYNYNGTGQNFQVFYREQRPDFIVPVTTWYGPDNNGDGIGDWVDSQGSPVAGLTNAENWRQYNIAIAGAVAACGDTTTHPEIGGFTCLLPNDRAISAATKQYVSEFGALPAGYTFTVTVTTATHPEKDIPDFMSSRRVDIKNGSGVIVAAYEVAERLKTFANGRTYVFEEVTKPSDPMHKYGYIWDPAQGYVLVYHGMEPTLTCMLTAYCA